MKKTFKKLVTLLLVVTMLLGITSVAVLATGEQSGSAGGGAGSGAIGGGVSVDWCDVNYDENGIVVTINANAEEFLGTNSGEIKTVLDALIDAVKAHVISDIKVKVEGEDLNVEDLLMKEFDKYVTLQYRGLELSEAYLAFLKDLLADTTNATIDGFVEHVCDMIYSTVSLGGIDVDTLPDSSAIEDRIADVFEDKINEYIDSIAAYYIGLYVDWLSDPETVIPQSVINLVNPLVETYVKERVNTYIDNGFKVPEGGDAVDSMIADYMNKQIKIQVNTWIRAYASNGSIPIDVKSLIESEIETWVIEIANAYGTGAAAPTDNPLYSMAQEMLEGILDDKVEDYIDEYLSNKLTDDDIRAAIKDTLKTQAPTLIYNLYWEHKDDGDPALNTDSFWSGIHNEIKTAAMAKLVQSGHAQLATVENYYDTTDSATLRAALGADFESQAKTEISNTISSYSYLDWASVWKKLTPAEHQTVIDLVEETDAFKAKVKDVIKAYWNDKTPLGATHRRDAVDYIINHDGYDAVLDKVIVDAENKAEYSDIIKDKVNEYLTDAIATLKNVVSQLSKEQKEDLESAIDGIVESKHSEIKKIAMDNIDGYVEYLLGKYDEVVDNIKSGNIGVEYQEVNLEWLISNVISVNIGDTVVFSDMTIDVEAIKQFIFELPTFEDIAAMTEDEMSLTYDVEIVTAFDVSSNFSITVEIGEGYEVVNKYATLAAEYIDFDMNDEGVVVFDLKVPEKFAKLVLKAANSDKVPEELKHKVFAAFSATANDAYAFINDVTFEEVLKVFDYVDFEEILDSEALEGIEQLEGLTEEQVKAKVKEYEKYFDKLMNLITKIFSQAPESLKSESLLNLYGGNGYFAYNGEISVDLEKLLGKTNSRYAALLASFMSDETLDITFEASVDFEAINKVEFIVNGEVHRVGFLPAGADLDYFANVDRTDVLGWKDAEGNSYETMPDADITLYAQMIADIEISPDIEKIYDGKKAPVSVSVSVSVDLALPSVTYQWYKDGVAIQGATLATIDVINVADSGEYYCEIKVYDGSELVSTLKSSVCKVKISKATLDLTDCSWSDGEFVYDGTKKSVFLVDKDGNRLPDLGIEYVLNVATNAGKYTAKAIFDTDNVEVIGTISDFEWEIKKATYDMSGVSFKDKTVKYTGEGYSLAIEGTLPEGVTVEYEIVGFANMTAVVDPDTYTVLAKFTGDIVNYEEIPSMSATLRILGYVHRKTYENSDGLLIVEVISANGKILETYEVNFKDVTPHYNYLESEEVFGAGKVGYVLAAYDIYFVDAGVQYPVEDDFTVRILIPKDLRGTEKELKFVHVAENGMVEDVKYTVDGDYLVFNTTHFSVYAITESGDAPVIPEEKDYSWIWIIVAVLVALIVIAIVVIIIIKKRKGKNPDEPAAASQPDKVPPTPVDAAPAKEEPAKEEPAKEEPAKEEPVKEEPVKEEPAKEAPVEEAPVEEVLAEQVPVEKAHVEEAPVKETPKINPTPVVIASADDEEGSGERLINGEVVHVRYRTSFMSRLIQAEEPLQDYYSTVKNALLSYKGVKARTSWNFESFNKGREQCAKLNIKGSAFQVYLALDPKEYNANKYHFVDVSDKPKLDKVPMLLKVKSERGLKYALELIEEMMNKLEMEKIETPEVDYHMPYETTEALAARDLVKIILPSGVTLDGDESFMKVDVGALIENATAEEKKDSEFLHVNAVEADAIISDEEAEAKIEIVERVAADESVADGKIFEINLDTICENFEDGDVVNIHTLKEKNLISDKVGRIKVLARGVMTKQLTIYADKFSLQAVKMITLAGGHADQYK